MENLTPEAVRLGDSLIRENAEVFVVDDEVLRKTKESYPNIWKDPDGAPELAFAGCPHFSKEQLEEWSDKIEAGLRKHNASKVAVPLVTHNGFNTLASLKTVGSLLNPKSIIEDQNNPELYNKADPGDGAVSAGDDRLDHGRDGSLFRRAEGQDAGLHAVFEAGGFARDRGRVLKKVPGHEKMIEACDYLNGKPAGDTVAVIGGGLTGCEIAYELFLQGKHPVIVEMKEDLIAQEGVCLANSSYLREYFAWKKVPVYLETTLRSVQDGTITVAGKDGTPFDIPCDSVISSAGYMSAPLAHDPKRKDVFLVGDCSRVGNLRSVIWSAYEAAMRV